MTKVVKFIEIDVPVCSLVWGEGVCEAGPGLKGSYYDGSYNEGTLIKKRVDGSLNFDTGEWDLGVTEDTFYGVWEGYIKGPVTGSVTFYIGSDDGSRLYIDDVLVIDNWQDQPYNEESEVYEMAESHLYKIKIEFFENAGNNQLQFSWSYDGQSKQIVPSSYLQVAKWGKCFNSFATCQDEDNYTSTTETVRFGLPDADDRTGIDCIPSLKSISFRPQQVSLGENLGVRASLTASFIDHRDADTCGAGDPYWSSRGYNPFEHGTFWGRFRARHKYLQGAEMRYIVGNEGQAIGSMETRTFVIEKISGPSLDGRVTITAKDVLKLADDEKAQCPVLSGGRLSADISNSVTSATLMPSGIGVEEYPAAGHVAIGGKEICSFTRSGDTLTLTRAQFGTEAIEHKQNDIVQICYDVFDDEGNGLDPADILYDWFVNYTTLPAEWINLSDWQTKTAAYIGRLYYGLIAKPTSVRKLAIELIEQTGIILWSDDKNKQVRLDVVRDLADSDTVIDEDVFVSGSFDVKDNPGKRVSQAWVYYGLRNPLESIDDVTNYTAAVSKIDEDAEDANGQPVIKQIFSRFIPRNNRPAATDLTFRILSRFREAPRTFEFGLWRFGDIIPSLAARYGITAWPLQDATGAQATVQMQTAEIDPGEAVYTVTGQEVSWYTYDDQPVETQTVVIDADASDINFRAEYDKSYQPPESGDTVTLIVEAGIKLGGSVSDGYALTIGSWPESGVTLVVINNGYIVGKQGKGGSGSPADNLDGEDGSHAIYTRRSVSFTNNGIIGAGGGGGGGGGLQGTPFGAYFPGGGGGSGAGYIIESGGQSLAENGEEGNLLTGGEGGLAFEGRIGGKGGDGGDLAESGSDGEDRSVDGGSGGAAGTAVDGDSYITWETVGDIRGDRIN